MILNGSEILVECLLEQGVDTIFGYPGGSVLNIYDAFYKYRDRIRHILTSHEQGASHAADGYARASGRVGVCIATSGPGATNLVTGIATAYMDSVPMVAITGNVTLPLLGKDSFQEVDIAGITMPITKHNFIVKDVKDLAGVVRRAFKIAREGRPGPVLIDITKDVTAAKHEFSSITADEMPKEVKKPIKQKQLKEAVALINESQKPLLYIGGGVIISDAQKELVEFVEKINAPVCSSSMGLGGIPGSNPRFTGMVGMHGTKTSNLATTKCDLLIAVGARFSDRVTGNIEKFAKNAKVLHIDIDPAEIDKNVITTKHLIGDVKEALALLTQAVNKKEDSQWIEEIMEMKRQFPLTYKDNGLMPQYVIEKISDVSKGEAIIATEVGQHQMWACQYIKFEKPRTLVTSGGLGTMGYGLGAAIGASVACPDKVVFNIAGDGCFRMNNIELATAVEINAPVIVVILNNHALGMVRQWQSMFYDSRFSNTSLDKKQTDFVKLAEAYNAVGMNVTTKEEFDEALEKAIALRRPVVINCEVSNDEKVFPMVAPGAAIDEIVME